MLYAELAKSRMHGDADWRGHPGIVAHALALCCEERFDAPGSDTLATLVGWYEVVRRMGLDMPRI